MTIEWKKLENLITFGYNDFPMKKINQPICKFILLFTLISFRIEAQSSRTLPDIVFSIFNANTMLPGGGDLFISSTVVHPGFNLGAEFILKNKGNSQFLYTTKLGYFYHRNSQYAIQLFGELGYRRWMAAKHFSLESRLAVGYLHSIPDLQVFKIDDSGNYQNGKGIGRPQAMIALSLCPSYTFNPSSAHPLRIFMDYQFMVQTPFVKNYVTILPYNLLHLGVASNFLSFLKK